MLNKAFIKLPNDWSNRFHNYLTCIIKEPYLWDDLNWFTEMMAMYYQYRLMVNDNDIDNISNTFFWVLNQYDQSIHASQVGFDFFENTYREVYPFLIIIPKMITQLEFNITNTEVIGLTAWYDDD